MIRQKRILKNLYDHLIRPIERYIGRFDEIILSPTERLHRIPLSIAYNSENDRYFNEEHELYFMPSIMASMGLYQHKKNESGTVKSLSYDRCLIVSHQGSDDQKLAHASQEADALMEIFKDNTRLSENDAKPEEIKKVLGTDDFDIVHFSCHGGFNDDYPDLSGLHLKGLLTAEYIATNLRIKSSPLVVMSACQTGLSNIGAGDELVGLNQAWLQAGATAIIGSLWSVNDASTMIFFKYFYDMLREQDVSYPEALRQAMRKIRQTDGFESAYYWGAFQVYGIPNNPVTISNQI